MRASRRSVSLGGSRSVPSLPPGAVDATRERLRQALNEGSANVEQGARRLADPFDVLHARGALDRDPGRNDLLWRAGGRFRRHWHDARLGGLTALDFSRPSVDGGPGPRGAGPTEAIVRHRQAYHRAGEAVGDRLRPFLEGMVIDGQSAKTLAGQVAEANHSRTAEAIVVERLREALHRLVDHWGLAGHPRRSAICRPSDIEER